MSFKKGDVVSLKSGGPDMTVSRVNEKNFTHGQTVLTILCTWFNSKGELTKKSFSPELLDLK